MSNMIITRATSVVPVYSMMTTCHQTHVLQERALMWCDGSKVRETTFYPSPAHSAN